jgi:hypothetical protein
MSGIKTSRHGPYAFRAACDGQYTTMPRDDALDVAGNYRAVAMKLATRMGWHGHWVGTTVPTVKGMVWVLIDGKIPVQQFDVPDGL